MDRLIVKHFYSDVSHDFISDVSFDIYKSFSELYDCLVDIYSLYCELQNIDFDESNILVYRCGSVSQLGEFRIYSNPLPIYLKDIKETLKNG